MEFLAQTPCEPVKPPAKFESNPQLDFENWLTMMMRQQALAWLLGIAAPAGKGAVNQSRANWRNG
jgi:hypothetical protein